MKLTDIAKEVHKEAVLKGWWDQEVIKSDSCPVLLPRKVGEQFANFHTEISEAWEEWRNGHAMDEIYFKDGKPEGVPIELADVFIRILDTCEAYKIDIENAIQIKMKYNKSRSHRHGGKRA